MTPQQIFSEKIGAAFWWVHSPEWGRILVKEKNGIGFPIIGEGEPQPMYSFEVLSQAHFTSGSRLNTGIGSMEG